jgi:hypothetical protein
MDALRLRIYGFIGFLLLAFTLPTRSQTPSALELFVPVTGSVESDASQSWSFTAASDAVLSFRAEATSGDLDPVMEIFNSDGVRVIGNDDYNYPDTQDALLEAIAMPRTDTFTVNISGFGSTSGDYTLTMLAGFAEVQASENFNTVTDWQSPDEAVDVNIDSGNMLVALAGPQQTGFAINEDMDTLADFYAQTQVEIIESQAGWVVGMTLRQQDDENYYLVTTNNDGQWRFVAHSPEGESVLRDWTTHPALIAGRTDFTLGVLSQGAGFEFFYNGQLFGQITDTMFADVGYVGLAVGTTATLTSSTVAQFDDLTITVPIIVNGDRIIPQEIIMGTAQAMVRELQHRNLIPAGGEMALTVEESFVESSRPGIQSFMLGRGVTYENLVMGASVTWQTQSPGAAGCGLILRFSDESHYTLAYMDQAGGYGVSQLETDSFAPGIFGEIMDDSARTHHLLLIANGDTIYYYLDGQFVGMLENPPLEGEIGNAVVNFEPIATSCQFDDTWVWNWN